MAFSNVLLLSLLAAVAFSCQPPDCDHPDCGSCVNACCKLQFRFELNFEAVYKAMVDSFKKGGADGRYTLAGTDDYRQDHPKGIQYMMQGIHTTLVHHYNDTLNFIIATEGSSNSSKTTVEAFSISQIHGAWCDDGQNYKNLVGYVKGLNVHFEQKTMYGCTRSS